ncbi:phosphate ABC transporter substrate-binding protein [Philodulcilactobacillus myokoensis]|uniref:Phosphate-binding protein n=1 Tax=Philodulcilactobacillus myokoensis TaxID=2929573 RepID=A0A9W6ETQ9_9LACO|nr:phosphate ABC transporter substrate-binding protein PstS family protein [Philodulcilactobacillus myokoensis]GLB47557.1 phosphate ABC transporter substrate-binding protein [Philodulcilactobacillus myokoensis]
MKFKKLLTVISVVSVAGAVLAGCGSSGSNSSSSSSGSTSGSNTTVNAVGSTALQPLVEQASSNYQKSHSGTSINVQGGGSGTGLSQVQEGAVSIGNSDIFAEQMKGINGSKLLDHQVAVVGMAPVVNSNAGVKNLSMKQLQNIFTGKTTNWKQVGGKNEKITVVNRAQGSGTRATFENSVLNGKSAVKSQEQDSNGTVQKIVSSTPGSVSYLAFSFINGVKDLTPLSINNVAPTDSNVETNKWKIWSYEHMYTSKKPSKTATQFINYIKSSSVQNSLVKKLGYINIHNMKVQKNANGSVSNK